MNALHHNLGHAPIELFLKIFFIKCYPNLFNNLELKSLKLTICTQNDKHTNRWG